jgi:uncharacterized protein
MSDFLQTIQQGYTFKGDSITIGGAIFNGESQAAQIKIPLKTLNRHGLIAGATGSGKTKTLQLIAEQLSARSIPVLLMDIKGDLSGIAAAGTPNPKIQERHAKIGVNWQSEASPVEFLSLSGEKGARLRATVTEFGPVLFSKILGLNDTQGSIVSVIFKYADDKQLALLDLPDLKKLLQYVTTDGKAEFEAAYGRASSASVGAILRKVVELEQQRADIFFGEPSFEVDDLVRIDENGKGMVSVIRLADVQDRPKLFSTFMLQLLAEIYSSFPEEGDLDQPKLCIFIDEAHLVFQEASSALLEQIQTIIKLIRSKGVGIFFITQSPGDIPSAVLGQLGLKIQHALRAFTAKDRKDIKLVAQNYPETSFYNVEELITQLGIGEALVTVLSEKGSPTPLVHTLLCAPQSRMDVLSGAEIDQITSKSAIFRKYNQEINRDSAYEILSGKLETAAEQTAAAPVKGEKSTFEKVIDSPIAKQVGRTVLREVTRGLLGVLGLGGKRRGGWF